MELNETARLKAGWNDHEVSTGGDQVSELVVELDHSHGCTREFVGHVADLGLEGRLACSENDDLNVGAGGELVQSSEQDIDALLLFKTADEAEHGGVCLDGETGLALQRSLGESLAGFDILGVVLEGQEFVQGGVPVGGVHAVGDTLHTLGCDHLAELDAELRTGGDLTGVVGRDGEKLVAGRNTSTKPVELSKSLSGGNGIHHRILTGRGSFVEDLGIAIFEGEAWERGFWQAELRERLRPETTLEGNIVDGVCHFGVDTATGGLVHVLDEDGDEGCVPVVGDEDGVLSRHEGKGSERFDGCFAEEGKTALVIDVVSTALTAVELAAGVSPDLLEEPRVIDPNAVDALLDGVEEANGLTVNFNDNASIPGVGELIETRGNGEDVMAPLAAE